MNIDVCGKRCQAVEKYHSTDESYLLADWGEAVNCGGICGTAAPDGSLAMPLSLADGTWTAAEAPPPSSSSASASSPAQTAIQPAESDCPDNSDPSTSMPSRQCRAPDQIASET